MSGWRVLGWDAVAIGDGVIGGTADCVLYIDNSGNLACDPEFMYDGDNVLSVGRSSLNNWSPVWAAIQLGGNASWFASDTIAAGNQMALVQNVYQDGGYKYQSTDEASRYTQAAGSHNFYVAASGAAGTAISWQKALTIPNFLGAGVYIGDSWEDWSTSFSVIQLGGNGAILSQLSQAAGNDMEIAENAYWDGSNWKRISADYASLYALADGNHLFYNGANGAADSNITWNVAGLTISASSLLIQNRDLYFDGAGSGLFYGSAQTGTTNIAWTQVAAQNTWYNISDSDIVDGDFNNTAHDGNGQLTADTGQMYDAIGIITIKSSIALKHVEATFSVNGTPRTTRGVQHHDIVTANSEITLPIADTLDLSDGDTVEIAVRTTDAGNPTLTVDHYTLKIVAIGGN